MFSSLKKLTRRAFGGEESPDTNFTGRNSKQLATTALGSSKPTGEYFEGDEHRISFEEAQRTRGEIKQILASENIQGLFEEMKGALTSLADGTLVGRDLSSIAIKAGAMAINFPPNISEKWGEKERISAIGFLVDHLGYAVALLEGNLPPNDQGFFPDQFLSLVRKDEIACEPLEAVYKFIEENERQLNETIGASVKDLYNRVADRVQKNRPIFQGKLVRKETIPQFQLGES